MDSCRSVMDLNDERQQLGIVIQSFYGCRAQNGRFCHRCCGMIEVRWQNGKYQPCRCAKHVGLVDRSDEGC